MRTIDLSHNTPPIHRRVARRLDPMGRADDPVLDPPRVPDALEDGTLPRPIVDNDVRVLIPIWTNLPPHEGDRYVLTFAGRDIGDMIPLTQEEIDAGRPIETVLPAAIVDTADGSYALGYWVFTNPGGETRFSATVPLIVDRTAPGGESLGKMDFDDDIEENGLSSEQLSAMGNRLPADISDYFGRTAGDRIDYFVGTIPAGSVVIGNLPKDEPVTVYFSRKNLEDAGGKGRPDFWYQVTDKANNLSRPSVAAQITLEITGAPENLGRPTIRAMNDTETPGLIVEAEARAGVDVTIPSYTNAAEGDQIILQWGSITLPPVPVRASDIPPLPGQPLFDIAVSYALVQQLGVKYSAEVRYQVKRVGTVTSPPATAYVDITIPGGPDPDPETPVNENLFRPLVRGRASGQDNVITADDSLVGGDATIRGLTNELPAKFAFQEGDILQLYWNSDAIGAPYRVPIDKVGMDLSLPITAEDIRNGGSGTVQAHYTATRALNPGPGRNTAYSPRQDVQVANKGDLPGGGTVDKGIFTEANANNAINRTAAISNGGTTFEVPYYSNKRRDDVLRLTFDAYPSLSGDGDPIPESHFTAEHHVGGDDEKTSYTFVIPTQHILAVQALGSARATYTATNAFGTTRSEVTFVLIDVR